MAPRNNGSGFKKGDDNDVDIKEIVPCLLHKKHKVIKLIRDQLENISQEGIFTNTAGCETETVSPILAPMMREGEEVDMNSTSGQRRRCLICPIFCLLLIIFLLIILMVWISAGPLSNSSPHTPIKYSSFVRTDSLCSLEKKYLLRWSKPEYY